MSAVPTHAHGLGHGHRTRNAHGPRTRRARAHHTPHGRALTIVGIARGDPVTVSQDGGGNRVEGNSDAGATK